MARLITARRERASRPRTAATCAWSRQASVRCVTSVTDQGQGTLTGIAQIVAETVGVAYDDVGIIAGDSTISPYGGGAWASRGMAIGGEAALGAGPQA